MLVPPTPGWRALYVAPTDVGPYSHLADHQVQREESRIRLKSLVSVWEQNILLNLKHGQRYAFPLIPSEHSVPTPVTLLGT